MLPEFQRDLDVHIRWMLRRDIPEVVKIENDSFEFPWSEDDFIHCLRRRNCIGMVAEHDEKIVGFMIYELPKTKIHLLTIATATVFRRMGVAEQLVGKLKSKLSSQRRSRITLEVRETNLSAQLFFKKSGFLATSVLKNFYDSTQEDAYLMQFRASEEINPSMQGGNKSMEPERYIV